jgi:hypothetical protein
MNWYKNHTVYEFVNLYYNLYNNCMNSFVWIRTKIISEKIVSLLCVPVTE